MAQDRMEFNIVSKQWRKGGLDACSMEEYEGLRRMVTVFLMSKRAIPANDKPTITQSDYLRIEGEVTERIEELFK